MYNNNMGKTIFLDVDGTILQHKEDLYRMITEPPNILKGTIDKLLEWRNKGYCIIITTSRPEGTKAILEQQLHHLGIFYDRLIMGLPTGPRVVINDEKYDGSKSTEEVCLVRNYGIRNIQI